eukprot:g65955.t1
MCTFRVDHLAFLKTNEHLGMELLHLVQGSGSVRNPCSFSSQSLFCTQFQFETRLDFPVLVFLGEVNRCFLVGGELPSSFLAWIVPEATTVT